MDGGEAKPVEGSAPKGARFRYFDLVTALFVAILQRREGVDFPPFRARV